MARATRARDTTGAPCLDGPAAALPSDALPVGQHDPGSPRGRLLGDPWSTGDRRTGRTRTRDRSA